jgi:hypothetical protein
MKKARCDLDYLNKVANKILAIGSKEINTHKIVFLAKVKAEKYLGKSTWPHIICGINLVFSVQVPRMY